MNDSDYDYQPWRRPVWAPPSPDTAQEALKRMYFESWRDAEQQVEDWKNRALRAERLLDHIRRLFDVEHSVFED